VVEPQGRFTLLALADGRELIQAAIEPEPMLSEVFLLGSDADVTPVTSRPATRTKRSRDVQPIPPGGDCPLVSGHVHVFERSTGRKLWPVGAVVEQHGLALNQPAQLPCLVFARHIVESSDGSGPYGGRPPNGQTGVLCLDKRTGRALLRRDDLPPGIAAYDVAADPARSQVTIAFAQRPTLVLQFTDEPTPPEPPWQSGLETAAAPRGRSGGIAELGGALIRAIGGGQPSVSRPEDDPPPRAGRRAPSSRDSSDEEDQTDPPTPEPDDD
jgi:hypothetical protein